MTKAEAEARAHTSAAAERGEDPCEAAASWYGEDVAWDLGLTREDLGLAPGEKYPFPRHGGDAASCPYLAAYRRKRAAA